MKRNMFKDTSKEERAKCLNNVICPKCGYQNHYVYAKKYGTCNLCKQQLILIISKNVIKKIRSI